jgi:hypothetical protein
VKNNLRKRLKNNWISSSNKREERSRLNSSKSKSILNCKKSRVKHMMNVKKINSKSINERYNFKKQ